MSGKRPSSAAVAAGPKPPGTPRAGRPASSSGSNRGRRSRQFVVPERRRRSNPNKTPGPGSYDVAGLSRYTGGSSPRSPGWGFGTASRSGRNARDKGSPGPGSYDVRGATRLDGGSMKRWTPNACSFPGEANRPSPFKNQRSPGPIYYYPDCEHDADHMTTPRYSIDRTAHASLSSKTIGPGPSYNLRDGKTGNKVLAIGDVRHKTAQWATCAARVGSTRQDDVPGPGAYDAAVLNKCGQNWENPPSYTMGQRLTHGDLPTRAASKGTGAPKVVRDPGIGPKYDVSAGTGGTLPNKANPPAISFGKDERFWEED